MIGDQVSVGGYQDSGGKAEKEGSVDQPTSSGWIPGWLFKRKSFLDVNSGQQFAVFRGQRGRVHRRQHLGGCSVARLDGALMFKKIVCIQIFGILDI